MSEASVRIPERARTVLVIEDEASIAASVAARLTSEGFLVETALDGPSGVAAHARVRPDLVVLDLMLPGIDGIEVCRRIQAERHVPVVMLTARDSENDMLVGLGVGADDYVTKPFSGRELVARIKAVLRRTESAGPESAGEGQGGPLTLGDVELDPASRRVRRSGAEVHLTPTEFELLAYLTQRRDVVTRDQLLAEVWGYRDGSGVRTVDSHIRALRRKLGDDIVRTVHGVGYAARDEETLRSGGGAR